LRADVADVELPLDDVAGEFEEAAEGVAVRGGAGADGVERPGGIGGDEFDLDFGAAA
jgi:hypothetical protein